MNFPLISSEKCKVMTPALMKKRCDDMDYSNSMKVSIASDTRWFCANVREPKSINGGMP